MGITTARKIENEALAPPPRDHNRPPLEELIPLEFREELLRDKPDFLKLMDDYLGTDDAEGAVHRAACANDDDLGKCGKLINALRAMEKRVGDTHVTVKAPYLQGGRLVDLEVGVEGEAVGRERADDVPQVHGGLEAPRVEAEHGLAAALALITVRARRRRLPK